MRDDRREMDIKLRLKGNSIRARLDRRDLDGLIDRGRVDDAVRFGPGPLLAFSYAVEVGAGPRNRPTASYVAGRLSIAIDRDDAEAWRDGDRVGFEHEQFVGGGAVRVLLEKDFACIDRPARSRTTPGPSPTRPPSVSGGRP
jgi:hypothetical protein